MSKINLYIQVWLSSSSGTNVSEPTFEMIYCSCSWQQVEQHHLFFTAVEFSTFRVRKVSQYDLKRNITEELYWIQSKLEEQPFYATSTVGCARRTTSGSINLLCLLQHMTLFLTGAESISVYEDVLRSVRYRLAKGSARFERRFRLSCSEMNGRYTSNELTLEVRPVHNAPLHLRSSSAWLCEKHTVYATQFLNRVESPVVTSRKSSSLEFAFPAVQVNFLHSLDSMYHPSHLLASQQQFLHPSHHAGELSGHTLPNPHRNSGDFPSPSPLQHTCKRWYCGHVRGEMGSRVDRRWIFYSHYILLYNEFQFSIILFMKQDKERRRRRKMCLFIPHWGYLFSFSSI